MHRLIITALLEKRNLYEPEAYQLLMEYGIPVPIFEMVKSADEVAVAAKKVGFPVVLKIISPDIIHKSDVGGVKANLKNTAQVKAAYSNIMDNIAQNAPQARIEGMFICRMQPAGGTECIIGMTRDATFGPTMMVGLGGIYVEILKDVSFRVLPFDEAEAIKMIRELKGVTLLDGVRGQKPRDIAALAEVLVKVGDLVRANPEIKELDINPCIVYEDDAVPVDARIII